MRTTLKVFDDAESICVDEWTYGMGLPTNYAPRRSFLAVGHTHSLQHDAENLLSMALEVMSCVV